MQEAITVGEVVKFVLAVGGVIVVLGVVVGVVVAILAFIGSGWDH